MLYDCEKAFVIIVTDGLPSRDDFDSDPVDTALGYSNFGTGGMAGLIGNYHADAETEEPGAADETAYYLDDIAKYMYDKDFRPDLGGTQTIDTYTVGFATTTATDDYLERTAVLGNGTFYKAKDGDQLTAALLAALNDIIEKSASFTAATVPSARTADGADFYQSFFFPRGKDAFWEGHVRAWEIDALGAVRDKTGACALDDPTAGGVRQRALQAGCRLPLGCRRRSPATGFAQSLRFEIRCRWRLDSPGLESGEHRIHRSGARRICGGARSRTQQSALRHQREHRNDRRRPRG